MSVAVQTDREGQHANLIPAGFFDLAHVKAAAHAMQAAEPALEGCRSVDLDLAGLERIDGAGAVLLARWLDRLDGNGCRTQVVERRNPEAARLIALYRRGTAEPPAQGPTRSVLARIGAAASRLPGVFASALDFTGRCVAAVPKAVAAPASVDWRSLPWLAQEIGAGGLLVTSAANLLIGLIIGFVGVSQLKRFGSVNQVPTLVVVAHFRELGPLVSAMIMAGRSGAGLASELATMKVSEEIDALRAMGFDPVRWLVIPRCLALGAILPLLTWIGDALALIGGFLATSALTGIPLRTYALVTGNAITASLLFGGLAKTPVLGLAIALIACSQGLSAQGGAAAVGARTTTAVVLSLLGVIVINAIFTVVYAVLEI